MKRNPPSPGFKFIGGGSFSSAYANSNIVEAISIVNESGNVDISKWIISKVRPTLSENAKRFLPDIRLDRIDSGQDGVVEYVYKMPLYTKSPQPLNPFQGASSSEFRRNLLLYHKIAGLSFDVSMAGRIKNVESLKFIIEKLKPICTDDDYSGLSEALTALYDAILSYAFIATNFFYDIIERNMALNGSQLILLDPFLLGVDEWQAKKIVKLETTSSNSLSRYLKVCTP
jgi:hypothetical protein